MLERRGGRGRAVRPWVERQAKRAGYSHSTVSQITKDRCLIVFDISDQQPSAGQQSVPIVGSIDAITGSQGNKRFWVDQKE